MSKSGQTEQAAAAVDPFFKMTEVEVPLTYNFTDPPTQIVFPCRLMLSDEDKDFRQAFYAQPEGDQANGLKDYQIEMLSRIVIREPFGLPGFSKYYKDHVAEGVGAALRSYLAGPEPMKQKIAEDAIQVYTTRTQPPEFFR